MLEKEMYLAEVQNALTMKRMDIKGADMFEHKLKNVMNNQQYGSSGATPLHPSPTNEFSKNANLIMQQNKESKSIIELIH